MPRMGTQVGVGAEQASLRDPSWRGGGGRRARRRGRRSERRSSSPRSSARGPPRSSPWVAPRSTRRPEWLKSFAIRTFGEQDKRVLLIGIGIVLGIAVAIVGAASWRRPRLAIGASVVLGAIGAAAAVTRPANDLGDAIPSIAGAAAGVLTAPPAHGARRESPTGSPAETAFVAGDAELRPPTVPPCRRRGRRDRGGGGRSRPAPVEPRDRRCIASGGADPHPGGHRSAASGGRGPRRAGRGAVPHAERDLLPRGHGAVRARDRRRARGRSGSTGWSTTRSPSTSTTSSPDR